MRNDEKGFQVGFRRSTTVFTEGKNNKGLLPTTL
jgi:hypothetical protein